MLCALLVAGMVISAVQAIRSTLLLESALWLAGVSALVAVTLFRMGARDVAVIELSVGAGLVTVLFVFAISIAGDDAMDARPFVPRPLALGLLLALVLALIGMVMPVGEPREAQVTFSFESVLWGDRGLDVLAQIVLIFTGVLCLLGLLQDRRSPDAERAELRAEQAPAAIDDGVSGGDMVPQPVPVDEGWLEEVQV